ncbi:hypothetical protein THRCLA_06400 [Thraustotheca clavata]|uniref:Ectopic P granules protein 5 n=1 Tax=Thraustotheca clavata TaxID=74557 RepID=A0A1V9ZP51_9STRA|nr:hypothetical protein THRCLA_06400 [Thraustotheca clavata]
MATLVRKKTKSKRVDAHPLVATGAPHRGNGSSNTTVAEAPIKIHLSSEELLLMDNFNDGSSPSAPDFDPQVDSWEAIMLGSPMPPQSITLPPLPTMEELELPPSAPTEVLCNGESPPQHNVSYLPAATQPMAPIALPAVAEPVPIEKKYVIPENATIATVHDLLVAAQPKVIAPIYPAMDMVKPIVFTPKAKTIHIKAIEAPPPLAPLLEVPHVHLRRHEHFEDNIRLRDEYINAYEERMEVLEKSPSDFYRLVEAYLYCEHQLRQATTAIANLQTEMTEKYNAVWSVKFESTTASAMCGDLKTLTDSVEYTTASMNLDLRDALVQQWQALRQLRTAEGAVYTFDRALIYLRIEQWIDNFLLKEDIDISSIQAVMDVLFLFEKETSNEASSVLGCVPTALRRGQAIIENDVKQLQCPACCQLNTFATGPCARCEALLIAPRSTVAMSSPEWKFAVRQFRISVQHWLLRCTTSLLTLDLQKALPYLLSHLMHLPRIANERQWAVSFLQLPPLPWTANTLDLFLSLWHLLFHPSQLPTQVVGSCTNSPRRQRSLSLEEWLLIETPTATDNQLLSDADYVAIVKQLPLSDAVAYILESSDQAQCFSQLLYLVNECTNVFERFADFDLLVAQVSQSLSVILNAAAKYPGSLFDQLFQIALFGVVLSKNASVYHSLPSWKYEALSLAAKWDALGGLFCQPSLSQATKNFVHFQCFLGEDAALRERLHRQVERGPGDYLLSAMAALAEVTLWSELVQTLVQEVFQSFLATKKLDIHVDVLTRICTVHPVAMSQILALLPQFEDGIVLFPKLPLHLWHPTPSDLQVIQAWMLQDNLMDKRSVLARSVVEQLNWGFTPTDTLFLDANTHRFIGLLLAEATVHFYPQNQRGWLWPVDMRLWCWTQMQRLHFYSKDYIALLPLIDLETDLSKEAMILRRLTKGLGKIHLVFGNAEYNSKASAAMCITYVDATETTTVNTTMQLCHEDEDVEDKDVVPLAQMEPIVLYALCQLTTHLFSCAVDKFAPLLSLLLDHQKHSAVLHIVECMLPRLSYQRLGQDDVAKFMKHYVEFNKDLRNVVAILHRNLYFSMDSRLPQIVQFITDGSVPLEEIIPIVLNAMEQSCCVHPLLLPALCCEVPTSYISAALSYAASTFKTFKDTVTRWKKSSPKVEEKPNHEGICRIIRDQFKALQTTSILQYWLVLVVSIPKWHERATYRSVVNTIFEAALQSPGHLQSLGELETPFSLYYDHLCSLPTTTYFSFVPPLSSPSSWSLFASSSCPDLSFTFLAFLIEIRKEKELYKALGHVVLKERGKHKAKAIESLRAKGRLANELYVYGVDTSHPHVYGHSDMLFASWGQFKLFRLAHVLLSCPLETPMLVLWWQLWFALYFASIGTQFFGHYLWELESKNLTRAMLQAKLRLLSSHFSAQVVSHPSPYASELARLYSAMDAWLENTDVRLWMSHKESLPPHYCIGHVTQLLQLSHVLLHTSDTIDLHTETICEQLHAQNLLWFHLVTPIATSVPNSPTTTKNSVLRPLSETLVAWPNPAPIKRFKYHRFSPVLPSEPGPLPYALNNGPFIDRATQYSELATQLLTMESDFAEKLSVLYIPKLRVVNKTLPCSGMTVNNVHEECKRPSAIRLEYTEWALDSSTEDLLKNLQVQASRLNLPSLLTLETPISLIGERAMYLQLTPMDTQVCFQILLIDAVVRLLTEPDPSAWKEQGVSWFHALVHLDSKLVRRFPPFQEVLWRSIKALGVTFIGVDQEETSGLLRFMLQDSARVCLLSDCFFPNNTPTRFVEYFANVMYHTQDLSDEDRLQLLRRFDMAMWLQHEPLKFDRDTLLSIVLAELVLGNNDCDAKGYAEIHRMHAKFLHVLCSKYLGDHVDKVVCALLGIYEVYYAPDLQAMRVYFEPSSRSKSTSKPLDVSIWQTLQYIPSDSWQMLPLETLQLLVDRVAQFFTTTRAADHAQFQLKHDLNDVCEMYVLMQWQSLGVLKPSLDLVVLWIRAQATAEMMWSILVKSFESMLKVLYAPAAPTEISKTMGPWTCNPNEEIPETAKTMCTALWSSFQAFLDVDTMETQIKLDCIWSFYLNVLLPHASNTLCKAYVSVMTRVPWDQWILTEECLNAMKDCLQSTSSASNGNYAIKFQSKLRPHVLDVLRDILTRAPWPEEWLENQPLHVQSSFFVKYHLLVFQLVVHHSNAALPLAFLSFLKQPKRLGSRPIKCAEIEAISNGFISILQHPTILCKQPDVFVDCYQRFVAGFRILLNLCGLDLLERTGDELKKGAIILHFLSVILNPSSFEWKSARDNVGHHNVYSAVVTAMIAAAAVVWYDILSILHVHSETYEALFKPELLQALYADIFRIANAAIIDRAFQQSTPEALPWMEVGSKLKQVCEELEVSTTQEVPLLEGHTEILLPASPIGNLLATMLYTYAGVSKHELFALKASCTAVASVHVMSLLCERSLETWITQYPVWSRVVEGLKIPELSTDEFVATCVDHNAFLTIVAYCLQQNYQITQATWEDRPQLELQYCSRLVDYLERCSHLGQLPAASEAKLLFLFANLFRMVLRLETVAITFKRDMFSRMSQSLWAMGESRQVSNGLDSIQRAIGFSFMNSFAKLKFSPNFHTAVLSLSLFVRVHSRKNGPLRLDNTTPLEVSKKSQKLIKILENVGTDHKQLVALVVSFCSDSRHSLGDYAAFFELLFSELYPGSPWLLKKVME